MHPFLTEPLVFGKPHPPWKEIWEQASRTLPLISYYGEVYDGATGKIYRSPRKFIEDIEDDAEAYPFAVSGGKPDYNYRLDIAEHWEPCPHCDGEGKIQVSGRPRPDEVHGG